MKVIVPPIKCQGIKTKLVPAIVQAVPAYIEGTWIEPFCGSCVVPLNVRPQRALLTDTNRHIINFYRSIQNGSITSGTVRSFLESEGAKLERGGTSYYMGVRARFNEHGSPLDFLFLSRACFNGVMRFNSKGKFNVPFCHKPDRFAPAYVTKIANQVAAFADVLRGRDWRFEVLDFRESLALAEAHDFVYVDPPYAGRHVDYYNSWKPDDEAHLAETLLSLPCKFLLSTWHSNKYRVNPVVSDIWTRPGIYISTIEHFYHVGSTEDLRNSMLEALIANYPVLSADASLVQRVATSYVQQVMEF